MKTTWIPRSEAATVLIEALRAPVEAINFKLGRRSRMLRDNEVCSRITQRASNGSWRAMTAPSCSKWSRNICTSAREVTGDQSARRRATSR